MKKHKHILICITALNILLTVYFLILAFYSRPHFDDLHFTWQVRDNGIYNFVKSNYFEWSGRFISYLLNASVYKIQSLFNNNLLFPFIFGLIGFSIFYSVVKKILNLKSWLEFNILYLFYWIYILTTFDFAAFNWYCAMSYFLIGPVHLSFVYLLNKDEQKLSITNKIFLFLICLFLGSGYEGYTPIVFIISFINIIYVYINSNLKKHIFKDFKFKRIISYNLILLLFFVIVIMAPGNYVRMSSLSEFNTEHTPVLFTLGIFKSVFTFLYFSVFSFAYYLIIFSIFAWFASLNAIKLSKLMANKISIFSLVAITFLIIICNTIIPVYLWGNFGVYRHYIPINFIIILAVAYFGLNFSLYYKKTQVSSAFIVSILLMLITITTKNIINDTRSAKDYALEVDNRLSQLITLNKNGQTGLVKISPIMNIPYTTDCKYELFSLFGKTDKKPVLYYISDVDTIVLDYSIHMRKLYNLNFDIVKSNDNNSVKP